MVSIRGEMLLHAKGTSLLSHLKRASCAARLCDARPLQSDSNPVNPFAQKLADELAEHDQSGSEDCSFLTDCTEALSSSKMLRHRDPDVRLLTACCLADLLRIYAPETPFDEERLKYMPGLQINEACEQSHPLIHRMLAVVQAFVLILELKCDDLICQLFETLFMSLSTEHELRTEQYMSDILSTVLEDLDLIPQAVLDTVLENLIEPRRTERPAAYHMARRLISRCSTVLARPIHDFLSNCLPSSSAVRTQSELREDWPHLLREVTSIDIEMVTYLLPQLQDALVMEEEIHRIQCTSAPAVHSSLLGKLFLIPEVNVARQFPQVQSSIRVPCAACRASQLFSGFLAKFIDASSAVRMLAVEYAAVLILEVPRMAEDLVAALKDRICDPDDKVRAAVVKLICDSCADRLGTLGSLLPELRHRISDKKPTVQKVARLETANLYRKHLTIHITGNLSDEVDMPTDIEWVPRAMLQIFGCDTTRRDYESRIEVEQLIQSKLLPAEEQKRLHALWKLKEEVSEVVEAMCADFPEPSRVKEVWEQLGLCKDQNVARDLLLLSSPSADYDELVNAQDDLRRRMSTRLQPPQLLLLQGIAARPAMSGLLLRMVHAVSTQLEGASAGIRKPIVALLCQACCSKDEQVGKLAAQCLSTRVLVAAVRSRTLATLVSKLAPLFKTRAGSAQHCALAVLGVLAKRVPDALSEEWEKIVKDLHDAVRGQKSGSADKGVLKARCRSQQMTITVLANDILGCSGVADTDLHESAPSFLDRDAICERGHAVIRLLLHVLECGGALGVAAEAGDTERAELRLSAVRGLLKLARIHSLKTDSVLGPLGWHTLALCMQDEEPLVRAGMARKVHAEHIRHFRHDKRTTKLGAPSHFQASRRMGLPPHYLTMLALAAVDPERAHASAAKAMLTQLVRLWHGTAMKHKKPHLLPELQLPWLLHTLGHHPDFESEFEEAEAGESTAGSLVTTQRCVDFYLSVVLNDGYCEYEMLRALVTIVRRAVDRVSPNGTEVRVVADVARALIVARSKDRKLSLPGLFFFKTDERQLHADVDLLPRKFEILDGLAKSKDVKETKRKILEVIASPSVKHAKAKTPTSRLRDKTPSSNCGKALPSPLPSAGGSLSRIHGRVSNDTTPPLLGLATNEESDQDDIIPDGTGASSEDEAEDYLRDSAEKMRQQREEVRWRGILSASSRVSQREERMRKRRIRHAKLNEDIVAESPEFEEPSDVKGMKRPPGEVSASVKAATRRKAPLLK
ncbi:MAG: hypothetical protein SGPRY_004459, partial [Prymnesium sp.]